MGITRSPKGTPLTERIKRSVVADNRGCWTWQGDRSTRDGYGRIWVDRKKVLAHRAAYVAFIGEIPPGASVLHRCDNPPCCNPEHLFVGSLSDNVQDALSKGRHISPKGERNGLAKLTNKAVAAIRSELSPNISELARRFGVSRRAIRFARNGDTWKA